MGDLLNQNDQKKNCTGGGSLQNSAFSRGKTLVAWIGRRLPEGEAYVKAGQVHSGGKGEPHPEVALSFPLQLSLIHCWKDVMFGGFLPLKMKELWKLVREQLFSAPKVKILVEHPAKNPAPKRETCPQSNRS